MPAATACSRIGVAIEAAAAAIAVRALASADNSPVLSEASGLRPFAPAGDMAVCPVPSALPCAVLRVAASALAPPPIAAIEPITATVLPLRSVSNFMIAPFVDDLRPRVSAPALGAGSSASERRLRAGGPLD